MKGKKRRLAVICLACLLLTACGSGGRKETPASAEPTKQEEESGEQETVYLSMATTGNWSDILRGDLWDEYCRKLSDWSGGKMIMRSYFNGALGTDLELIEGVAEGTLCIINSVPAYQISVVPEAALLDVPGLFESPEEYNFFIENYYMDTIQSFYQAKGIRLLVSSAFDFRVLTSNTPIRSMQDLKDLKLRTMENKYHIAFWQAMGASAMSMSFNQVGLAIQQGFLQAQENPLGYMISSRLSEVQDQVVRTNHELMISNFLMNEEQYQALTEENKAILQLFLEEMSRELVQQQPTEDAMLSGILQDQGIQIYSAPEDIRQAIVEKGKPVVLDLLRDDLGEDVVKDFLEKVEQAKAAYHQGR